MRGTPDPGEIKGGRGDLVRRGRGGRGLAAEVDRLEHLGDALPPPGRVARPPPHGVEVPHEGVPHRPAQPVLLLLVHVEDVPAAEDPGVVPVYDLGDLSGARNVVALATSVARHVDAGGLPLLAVIIM